MRKIISFVMLICCINCISFAQQITVLNSTAQPWSGGVAGRTGCYYKFTIQFSGFRKKMPVPDTMWIGNEPIPLYMPDTINGIRNMTYKTSKDTVTFAIEVQTEYNEYRDNPYADEIHFRKLAIHAPVKYEGVAMLSYIVKGKHKYYVIPEIMKSLKPLEYP